MNHNPILEGNCYVLHQGYYNDILRYKNDGMILWPEKSLTMIEVWSGVLYKNSIITEDASMIACYDRKNVWIWREENGVKNWVNPDIQTFGASHKFIMSDLLFINSSIPMRILSSKIIEELKLKLKELYDGISDTKIS